MKSFEGIFGVCLLAIIMLIATVSAGYTSWPDAGVSNAPRTSDASMQRGYRAYWWPNEESDNAPIIPREGRGGDFPDWADESIDNAPIIPREGRGLYPCGYSPFPPCFTR